MGFVLLSATVAWTLGVHPALARRRAVALRLSHVRRSRASADALDSDGGAALLDGLASAISVATVDFMQYPESYYFEDVDENTALPRHLGYAAALAEQAATARHPNVRLAGLSWAPPRREPRRPLPPYERAHQAGLRRLRRRP